jgi:hypothetical protein
MLKRITIALSLLLLPAFVSAQGKTREQLAAEIVAHLQTDDQFDEMIESIVAMQEQVLKGSNLSDDESRMDAMVKELTVTMKAEFSKSIKQDMAAAYAAVFTQEELQGLLDFYGSPVGKKYVEKLPELTEKSAELQQKTFAKMWPKIEQTMQKYLAPGTN